MNKERILQVADAIEQHTLDLGFNMQFYLAYTGDTNIMGEALEDMSGHNCGTLACVAGWAYALKNEVSVLKAQGYVNVSETSSWLGITADIAEALFHGRGRSIDSLAQVSQAQAVRTLRHLAETGQVDWTV